MECKILVSVILLLLQLTINVDGKNCSREMLSKPLHGTSNIKPMLNKNHVAMLMLLGFGGLSGLVALLYKTIRRRIFQDQDTLDATFDAGGNVSVCLTAVTVASQTIWPGDFLQGVTMASKVGLSTLFSLQGFVVALMIFPLLTLSFKANAPGAKTYLQVVYARFGTPAHVLFCIVAFVTSLFTLVNLIVTVKAVFDVFVKDASDELVVLILAVLCSSYCCIGGLGSTFYISYLNTVLIFVSAVFFICYVSFLGNQTYTSHETMYEAMSCIKGPAGNQDNSFLTFHSRIGGIFGISTFFGVLSTCVCDQAYWQSRIATTPKKGALGFFLAVFIWFAVMPTVEFTAVATYFSISYQNSSYMLNDQEVDSGFILPFVLETLFGSAGGYLMLISITMALMSTGSGEIMALASIIVYDVYKTYINPYRRNNDFTHCLLCGKTKNNILEGIELCNCTHVKDCSECKEDIAKRNSNTKESGIYRCPVHAQYRHYEDGLVRYRNWCIAFLAIGFVPFGILILSVNMTLNWLMMFVINLFTPFVTPIILAVSWSKVTSTAIISGSLTGLAANVISPLVVAATYYEDSNLEDFEISTTEEFSVLAAYVSGFSVSTLVTIILTVMDKNFKNIDPETEWMKTKAIDNPLNPWRNISTCTEDLPSNVQVTSNIFSEMLDSSRKLSLAGGVVMVTLFGVVASAVVLSLGIFDMNQFSSYLTFFQVYCVIMAIFVTFAPPLEEGILIWQRYHNNINQETLLPNTSA